AAGRGRAQVGVPGGGGRAGSFSERGAMGVGAFEPAEVGALARAHARDEERHACILRLAGRKAEADQRRRGHKRKRGSKRHGVLPVFALGNSEWRVANRVVRLRMCLTPLTIRYSLFAIRRFSLFASFAYLSRALRIKSKVSAIASGSAPAGGGAGFA